ncbi:hypothetical protein Ct61P_15123 [Colletotrichum tofieldiae]|nr:hypothetical protein Ct61P_15123 [Colletotrichum tofieldiae]
MRPIYLWMHHQAKLILAAFALLLGILVLISARLANYNDNNAYYSNAHRNAVGPKTQRTQTKETAAMASICRAHHAVSALPLATAAGWPTLSEFVSVDVSRPPFATAAQQGRSEEDRGGGSALLFERQNTAVIRGWAETYENLLHRKRRAAPVADDDYYDEAGDETGQVIEVLMLVGTTLRNPDARVVYLYNLLPQMEAAAVSAMKRRRSGKVAGEMAHDAVLCPSGMRDCKWAMMDWLRAECV